MKAIITDLNTCDETLLRIRAPKVHENLNDGDAHDLREDTIDTLVRDIYKTAYPERFNYFRLREGVETNAEGEEDVLALFGIEADD